MTGTVVIEGLRLSAHHGVLEQERVVGNVFELDISLQYNCEKAMETDDIDTALNYASVVEIVREQMQQPSQLLENVVGRIKDAVNANFSQVTHGTVTLYKIKPPIPAQLRRVGFSLSW